MDKKEFLESLDYYIFHLIIDRSEIFAHEMIANFHIDRESIEEGLKEYNVSSKKMLLLKNADQYFISIVKDVLIWWEKDGIFSLRERYKNEITKEMWYWWIDEIVKGEYPIKMIPDHLKKEVEQYYK